MQNGAWAKFSTFYTGKQAQLNQLALDLTRFDTISELISDYAPPSSNDTQAYTLTKQTDVLHADLIAGQGYVADAAVDLLACYNGNQLNTPQAIANLEQEKANL